MNTSQLHCIAERHTATTLQSSDSTCSAERSQNTTCDEPHNNEHILVHTADSSYTAVDMFHAYCALAVVRHRLSASQCTMNCCKHQLSARQVAGLSRLLLWDADMCQRRWSEELLYIQQLQTSLSNNRNQAAGQQSAEPSKESHGSGANDLSQDTSVCDELSSHDEPSVMRTSDLVSDCAATAVDDAEVNDVERVSAYLQQHGDWQTLPVDVKYSKHKPSVELLEQEADRLRHLCDDSRHGMVIHQYYISNLLTNVNN